MTILITGGTGLLGQALLKKLMDSSYKIHLLCRRIHEDKPSSVQNFLWPSVYSEIPKEALPKDEKYGVIHLAGEPVSHWPWTSSKKEKIYSSRIEGTKKLVKALKENPPEFFISSSAIGIYGEQDSVKQTENLPISPQNLFLQKVCKDWEASALPAGDFCRTVVFRWGVVMSYQKGFLYEQAKWMKRAFLPKIIGENSLSWIALEDAVSLVLWAIENKSVKGIYNASSPYPVPLKDFYKILSQEIKSKKIPLPLPLFLMKRLGGEMTKNLLASCRAYPEKALKEGFVFKQAKLEEALKL